MSNIPDQNVLYVCRKCAGTMRNNPSKYVDEVGDLSYELHCLGLVDTGNEIFRTPLLCSCCCPRPNFWLSCDEKCLLLTKE
jgi:hypothetical protein